MLFTRPHFIFILSLSATVLMSTVTSFAAGRTYKSTKEDMPEERELCRFEKLMRSPEGNTCVYARQSGGNKVFVGIDQLTKCVVEFQCKVE
jgi:hypothetical protein